MRILAVFLALALTACSRTAAEPQRGDAARGRELAIVYECWDCHIIPGIDRKPGPGVPSSLDGFADKSKFANGTIENTRANLEQYLQKPKSLYPRSTMPGLGDRPKEAEDIAAFMMTLD